MKYLFLLAALTLITASYAQNVGIGNTNPHTKLEVSGGISSTPVSAAAAASVTIPNNSSIFRLTAVASAQVNALGMASPQEGQYLTIYNEDNDSATFAGYTIIASGGVISLEYINAGWRLICNNKPTGPQGPAGGDLSGTYPNPTVIHIQGDSVSSATPHTGDILVWTGTAWTPTADSGLNWKLIGNGGTNPLVNFIGTTDTQKLEFRVNNLKSGEIDGNGNNTFLGYQSGPVNTGGGNAGMGSGVLKSSSTGGNNAAMGNQAMYSNTSGNSNVAMGVDALYMNAIGGNLVAIGDSALYNDIGNFTTPTGVYNVAVGSKAMFANTTGYSNTAVGSLALKANTTGIYNTAMGRNALLTNTTGGYNTAIGHDALFLNTIGQDNTAVGESAGFNQTSAYYNTAMGMDALFSDTSGGNNTATGFQSMYFNLSGGGNTATGWLSLPYNVTGNFNTAEGYNALYYHNTGDFNTGVGTEVMFFDSTGSLNAALGWRALRYNKTGTENTAIGVGALEFASPINYNTAVGRGAGSAILGDNNTVMGIYAGRLDSASYVTALGAYAAYNNQAGYNTFVGSFSGGGNRITGIENTGLAGYALYSLTSGHSNTASGYGSLQVDGPGSGNTANGTRTLFVNYSGNGNTAVGDSALYNSFASYNTALGYSAGPAAAYGGLSNTTCIGANSTVTANNAMILGDGTVNVGVGVTAPLARMDISYNSNVVNPQIRVMENDDDYARINYMNSNSTTKYWASAGYISATSDSQSIYNIWYGSTPANIMSVTGNNRVGIMTTVPRTTLDLFGDFAYRVNNSFLISAAANNNVDIYTNKFSSYRVTTSLAVTFSFSGFNGGSDGRIVTLYNSTAQNMILQNQNALSNAAMEIITGIGADLTVYPGGSVTMQYNGSDSRWVVIASNNSGNTNPGWNLTGNSNTTAASAPVTYGTSTISSSQDWIGTTNTQDLVAGTNQIERMRIKQGTGYVGIGTANPNHELDVYTSTASISATNSINVGAASGTGWGPGSSFNGVTGEAGSGSTQYQAGVFGYQIGGGINSGGVVGAYSGAIWAALGYTDASSNRWGMYSNSQAYVNYNGDNVFLQLNTTATTNKRTRINFSQNNTIGMELATDYNFNNTTDLYIYNRATGSVSACFNPGTQVFLTARNNANDFYITNAGRVGIGTNAPTDLLSVNGNANNTTGSWGVFSDARVKTVTGDFNDGLDVIRQIHPVKFRYNENAPFKADGEQIGIVAQDLEKIAPYMVTQKEYKDFKDLREVSNQAYVFLLINGVKEQQKRIDEQKSQSEKQQQIMDQLKKQNEALSEQNRVIMTRLEALEKK